MMALLAQKEKNYLWKLSKLIPTLTMPERFFYLFKDVVNSIQHDGVYGWVEDCLTFSGQKDFDILMYTSEDVLNLGLQSNDDAVRNIAQAIQIVNELMQKYYDPYESYKDLKVSCYNCNGSGVTYYELDDMVDEHSETMCNVCQGAGIIHLSHYITDLVTVYAKSANTYTAAQWDTVLYQVATQNSLIPDLEKLPTTSNKTKKTMPLVISQYWQLTGWINLSDAQSWYNAGWEDAVEAKRWYPDYHPEIAFLLHTHNIDVETITPWVEAGWGPYLLTAIEWIEAGHTDPGQTFVLAKEGYKPSDDISKQLSLKFNEKEEYVSVTDNITP